MDSALSSPSHARALVAGSDHHTEKNPILRWGFSRLVSCICHLVKRSVGVLTVLKRKMDTKVEDAANWFMCFMQ